MAGAADYAYLYRTNRWKKKSEAFRKANPLCAYCRMRGRAVASEVADHRDPHKGDVEAFNNGDLIALCKACHDSAKKLEEHGKRSFDASGEPIGGW